MKYFGSIFGRLSFSIAAFYTLALITPWGLSGEPGEHKQVVELDPLVVTATRTARLQTEVPIKTEVLGASDFELAAKYNLGEAIEFLNGARTENNCQNCGTAEIQLLGLPGNYNQILIDKQPLFTGVASVYGIDQIPTIFAERIEIVKGGASALYGPGAVAGVINVIPHEPYESHHHFLYDIRSIDGETTQEGQFSTSFVPENSWIKGTLYGVLGTQNPVDINGDGFTELTEKDKGTVGVYLWATPGDNTRIKANYQYIYEDRRGGNHLERPSQFSQISEALETDYHWATLSLEQIVSDSFDFTLTGSAVYFTRDSFYGGTGDELVNPSLVNATAQTYNGTAVNPTNIDANGEFTGTANTDEARAFSLFGDGTGQGGGSFNQFGYTEATSYLFDSQFNYDLGEAWMGTHLFTFGFQYEQETLTDENRNASGRVNSVLHDDTFDNIGFYFQDQWQINPRLEFVPGIRFDKANTLDDFVVSPRLALRYTATQELTLRSNISSGFLAPRVFDEDIHVDNLGGQPVDIVNAPGLKEERSYTFALGMDYTPERFEGDLTTSFQGYYTFLEDSFATEVVSRTGPRGIDQRINSSGSTVIGLEWDFSYRLSNDWRLDGGLAYIRSRFDDPQEITGGDNPISSKRYNKTPDWSGLLSLAYINPETVNGVVSLKWTGPMQVGRSVPNDEVVDVDSFYVVNIGLSKTFNLDNMELTIKAGIDNVFDEFQEDLQSGAGRDSDFVYGPRFPRTYYAGVGLDF